MTEDVPLRPLTGLQQMIIALALVSMGAGFAVNFMVVSPLAREAGLTEIQVALVLVGSAALYAGLTPKWGALAERFGRKRVMVFSLCAAAATNALFIFALDAALQGVVTGMSAFWLLVVTRLSFGLLSPGLHPASMAVMADATTAQNRAAGMGLLGASMAIGSIVGPAGIAVLAPLGTMAPIWGTVVFSLLCGVIIAFALPPTREDRDEIGSANRPPPLKLSDRRILPYLLFLLLYFIAVGAIQQAVAWLVQDRFDLDKERAIQLASLVYVSLAVTMVATQFGYIQRKKPDPRGILVPGLILIAGGYLITGLAPSVWLMCAGFAIGGIGASLAVAALNALGSMSVPVHDQGRAASLLAFAPPAGYVAGPLMGATLYMAYAPLPLFVSAGIMGALAAFAALRLLRRDVPAAD